MRVQRMLFPLCRWRRSKCRRRDVHLPDVVSKTNVEAVEHPLTIVCHPEHEPE